MKVLFQSRSTLFSVPGGDTVQLTKTADFLRKMGVEVDISLEFKPSLKGYDLVHLFNLMRPQEVYVQAINAKKKGLPVVLSTIYGLYTEYEHKVRPGFSGFVSRNLSPWKVETLKVVTRALVNGEISSGSLLVTIYGYKKQCERVAGIADVFLPNSSSEMARVHADFPQSCGKPFVVVPNAVDTLIFDPQNVTLSNKVRKFQGCVVSAARIEGRKCQLELVRAVRNLDVDLVLIGKPAPNHIAYYEAVKRESNDRVHFLGQVNHDQLAQYYAAAKVHALISWMETPGLSSLEAGAMGCNLVVTEKGDTRDYFMDDVHYCNPESIDSIRLAIQKALTIPKNKALSERIRTNYTWENTAKMTLSGYKLALES